jgi:hypothetical protein
MGEPPFGVASWLRLLLLPQLTPAAQRPAQKGAGLPTDNARCMTLRVSDWMRRSGQERSD